MADPVAAPRGAIASDAKTMPSLWRQYRRDLIWAARITLGLVLLLARGTWIPFWHGLSFLIILAVLTYPVRSVRWGRVYNFFLLGFFFAIFITGAQYLIEKVLLGGRFPLLGDLLVAPVTEEPLKLLPLLVALWIPRWGFRHAYGACDLMLCAAALGSGFGFFEDVARVARSYKVPNSPELFGVAIFPDSYSGFIGHGGATAFIGLAVGYLLYAARWRLWAWLGWIGVGVVASWMMIDHAFTNYNANVFFGEWFFLLRWIWELDGRGRLAPYILFALILGTIAAERYLLWRTLRGFPRLRLNACLAYLKRPLARGWGYPQVRAVVMRLRALGFYILSRRQLGYLGVRLKGDAPLDRTIVSSLIAKRAGEILVARLAVRAG